MDALTREKCKFQLEELARVLAKTEEKEADQLILETCASLISAVENGLLVDMMTKAEVKEHVENYKTIYYVMYSFMDKAANTVPVGEEEKTLIQSQRLYDERVRTYEDLKIKRNKVQDSISTKDVEIESLYQENGILFRKFEELSQKLDYLRDLQEKYDPEKLDSLRMEVEQLKQNTDELREEDTFLNTTTAECLGELSSILDRIGKQTSSFSLEVEKTKQEADEFRAMIETCSKTVQNYRSWFNVTKTPWQQLEDDIGTSEYSKLKGVINEDTLKQKNDLVRSIESDLKKFEGLVAACTLAAQSDYKKIIKDAGK